MNKKKGTDRNLFGMKVQVIYQVSPPPPILDIQWGFFVCAHGHLLTQLSANT